MGKSGVIISRARNAGVLDIPQVLALVQDAVASHPLVKDTDAAVAEVAAIAHLDEVAVWVVSENDKWVGFAFATAPVSAFCPMCTVIHFYCKGTAKVRKALIDAIGAFARENGCTHLFSFDANAKPAAFVKIFKPAGDPESVGASYTFKLRDE